MRRFVGIFVLSACVALTACGGGGGSGLDTSPPSSTFNNTKKPLPPKAPSDGTTTEANYAYELNPANALIAASIANQAIGRYLALGELTSVLDSKVLPDTSLPAKVACSSSGNLDVHGHSGRKEVEFNDCKTDNGIVFILGKVEVAIEQLLSNAVEEFRLFDLKPAGLQVTDEGSTYEVYGDIRYRFHSTVNAHGQKIATYDHQGRLGYIEDKILDDYRNIDIEAVTIDEDSPSAGASLMIKSLSINKAPFFPSLKVTTASPLTFTSDSVKGSITVSAYDNSRVEFEYVGVDSIRIRNWDNKGTLVMDSIQKVAE